MEYLLFALLFTVAFLFRCCFVLTKKTEMLRDRLKALRETTEYLERRVGSAIDLAEESRKEAERTEKKFFEGVSNIMNYDLAQARKGAGHGD